MESDVARFLWEKYINSMREVESGLTASILHEFRSIRDELEENSSFSITHAFISTLYNLNDALDEWRVFMTQRKGVKKMLRKPGVVRKTKERLSRITKELNELFQASSSSPILDKTNSQWDRFTFDEPHLSDIKGFDKHAYEMVSWLWSSDEGFKAIGIYGMGGTGKTTLVRKVLQNPTVRHRFKHIIWACLSDLTSDDEIDIRIVKYLLNYFGDDIDSFYGYRNEEVWLTEQLKLKLLDLGNYVVVFDDVWVCNDWFVDLCHKLGEPRKMDPKLELDGAVIVTSRKKEVAQKMVNCGNKLIHLSPLENYKENGEFLKDIVKQNMKDANANENMENEIVHHCYGLPLAAKTLPGVSAKAISQEAGQIS